MGPTLYLVMESDLHPKSAVKLLIKYANDTKLLVPENSDGELADEFRYVKQWADENKEIINQCKTKEIVFRRRSSRRLHMYSSENFACISPEIKQNRTEIRLLAAADGQ